jgi:hypothetical protein
MTEPKPPVIIQMGSNRTGSTLLVNLLYGFIIPNEGIRMFLSIDNLPIFSQCSIVKTHLLDIDGMVDMYNDKYDLYFIISERNGRHTPTSTRECKKLHIKYDDILETETNNLQVIVDTMYNALRDFLPAEIPLSKDTAFKRISEMNTEYERIKDFDFHTYVNYFYELHGSHRNPEISRNWP